MKLTSVYRIPNAATYLYALLTEREAHQNISHARMPTVAEHLAFVQSRPYAAWYLVRVRRNVVGAVYLSKRDELGIFIFKAHRGYAYGEQAIRIMRKLHPKPRLLANVNPNNASSIRLFEALGGKLLQVTFSL